MLDLRVSVAHTMCERLSQAPVHSPLSPHVKSS